MPDKQSSTDYFDRWAPRFEKDRMSPWFQHYQTRVLDRVAETGCRDLLDVGCGTGWLVRTAARRLPGSRAVGIDLSPGMVGAARTGAGQEGCPDAQFLEADAANLPFAAGAFDCITCTASFHHYVDPAAVLQGWRTLLRPGGRILLLESCTGYFPIWVYDKVLRILEKGHVRYYRTRDLLTLVQEAGFEKVRALWRETGVLKHGKLFTSLVLVEGRKKS